MSITDIESIEELDQIIKSTDELIIIDFFAHWCGPCSMMAPEFEKLATVHENVIFLRVDVVKSTKIAQAYGIKSMPSFVFLRSGLKLEHIVASKPEILQEKILEFLL